MKKLATCLVAALVVALALPAMAQAPSGEIAHIYFTKATPGHEQLYELGRKRHMEFHGQAKDTWNWHTWEVLTGENTGSYVTGTFGHNWSDFDGREKFDQADGADAAMNLAPHAAGTTQSFYVRRTDMIIAGALNFSAPLLQITDFYLRPEGVNTFVDGVKKINEAAKKANWPARGQWYQLVSGGNGPVLVLVNERRNWADFQPPEKSLDAMVKEVMGEAEGAAMLESLRKQVRYTNTSTLRYRAELSYVPASK